MTSFATVLTSLSHSSIYELLVLTPEEYLLCATLTITS
jgi:hypothetical protein